MKREILRLALGCSVSLIFGIAAAQNHNTGGSGGNGGGNTRSTGGGGSAGSGSRPSGGPTGGQGGGYRGGYHSQTGNRYQGGNYGGNSNFGQSGYSRYQSRSGGNGNDGTRSSSYSRSGGYYGQSHTSSYTGRSGGYSRIGVTGSTGTTAASRYTNPDSGFTRGHSDLSRSGQVHYNSNNNLNGSGRSVDGDGRVGTAPRGLISESSASRVIGVNNPGLFHGRWRTGYFGYRGGWRDDYFAFPFYVFDPWFGPCYASPWWYYPCLPAYVAAPDAIIVDSYPSTDWSGSDYGWNPGGDVQDAPNQVLDDSVQDLVAAFEGDDQKAIDRVTPHSGNVNIYTDGKYAYSLKANDFYDTYVDGIESTKTDRYEIVDVKEGKDGKTARVTAKHVYNDPWGNRTYVFHSYFLVREGDEYVIREFGTSESDAGQ